MVGAARFERAATHKAFSVAFNPVAIGAQYRTFLNLLLHFGDGQRCTDTVSDGEEFFRGISVMKIQGNWIAKSALFALEG